MKNRQGIFLLLVFQFIVGLNAYGQTKPQNTPAYIIIEKRPLVNWSKKEKGADLSDQEKLDRLKMLPTGERVEFERDYDEETDETFYFELSLYGLTFLDLDFDGDLDLLYSSIRRGGMGQLSTKVYYNINNVLEQQTTLRNGILDIKKNNGNYEVYTLFHPCCDSYTTRIDQYRFSDVDTAVFVESISLMGRSYLPYKGMLDFSTKESLVLENPSLYAFKGDIRNGYFRKRNKEVKSKLKEEGIIELLKVEGIVKAGILESTEFKGEKYYLVITEPLSDLPKMPTSLYEWSHGDGRRLVGWIKAEEVIPKLE